MRPRIQSSRQGGNSALMKEMSALKGVSRRAHDGISEIFTAGSFAEFGTADALDSTKSHGCDRSAMKQDRAAAAAMQCHLHRNTSNPCVTAGNYSSLRCFRVCALESSSNFIPPITIVLPHSKHDWWLSRPWLVVTGCTAGIHITFDL